jgi:site-specific recombinase XerD
MINRENYRLTEAFLCYLRDVEQVGQGSFQTYRAHLKRVLLWAGDTEFAAAESIRPTLPRYLEEQHGTSQVRLSGSTVRKSIQLAKRLFIWAKMTYPADFRQLTPAWIEILQAPRWCQRDTRPVDACEHVFVTLDEVRRLVCVPHADDLAILRDKAAAALLYCSGMRAGAVATLPIAAVDIRRRLIKQWTTLGVRTKNGKSRTTYLLNIPELLAIAEEWDAIIRARLPETALWFTPIIVHWGEKTLSPKLAGHHRNGAISDRLRILFARAGLEYKSAHKFRHGHAVFALQHARSMADYKAVSQNLLHGNVKITDEVYAPLLGDEVQQRIDGLTQPSPVPLTKDGEFSAYLRQLSKDDQLQALHILADELARS